MKLPREQLHPHPIPSPSIPTSRLLLPPELICIFKLAEPILTWTQVLTSLNLWPFLCSQY